MPHELISVRSAMAAHAKKVCEKLLETWCEAVVARKFDQHVEFLRREEERVVLERRIDCDKETVRENVLAFVRAYSLLYGAAISDAMRSALVTALIKQMHPNLARKAPAEPEAVVLLAAGADKLAAAMVNAAIKASRSKNQSTARAAAPTEAHEEREASKPAETRRGATSRSRDKKKGCYECGKEGHLARDCEDKKEKDEKEKICLQCGEEGHFQRKCPDQVCHKCKQKGHRIGDCPAREDRGANKSNLSKYENVEGETAAGATVEAVPAAAVLLVSGTVDGHEAKVGLDSFAGAGMVTKDAVLERKDEWRPTDILLQGVSEQMVKPHGEVDVVVTVGEAQFTETVMICDKLPGGADVLVSYDTMRKQGMSITEDKVVLAGQTCTVVAPVAKKEEAQPPAEEDKRKGAEKPAKPAATGKEPKKGERPAPPKSAKATEKAARVMLRETDANFKMLEAAGRIEQVLVGPDGLCEGYRVRAEENGSSKQEKKKVAKEQDKEKKKMSAAELKQVRKEAKKRKERARKEHERWCGRGSSRL